MKNLINILTTTNKFKVYTPFFRVFVCLFLLKDIVTTWDYIDLLFKGNSFLHPTPFILLDFLSIDSDIIRANFEIFYAVYIILILLYLFGIGKHITAFLVLICLDIVQNLSWVTLNGGDNILKIVLIYMVFMNTYSYLSIKPLKYRNQRINEFSNFISNLGGLSICIHLCLVYFISAIHKIHADVWFNGIATYYILAGERFNGTPWNIALVKNGLFVTLSTYGTIIIELLFPFLVWFNQTKKLFIIAAILLHTGIAIFMMLYDFQLIFIVLQGFFFTNSQWLSLIERVKHLFYRYFSSESETILKTSK
ncbi:HTTM domain-containing protein [Aquimarina sp. 2201CG1-2-11]|uniref:HTTM domain-containing protein n=1 Tax=Aquimarina discodermiae TaxID=3231043 RepID=UPI00346185C7